MRMLKPQDVPRGRQNDQMLFIYVAESQFKSVEVKVLVPKGSVSYGLGVDFSLPHCLVVGQGIGLNSENHLRLA